MDGAEEDENAVNDDTDSIRHTRHYGRHSICVDIWLVLAEMRGKQTETVVRSGRFIHLKRDRRIETPWVERGKSSVSSLYDLVSIYLLISNSMSWVYVTLQFHININQLI